ncbi:MAG: HEAT repeat domain-containing protein [Gemmataceae bacterium]
MKNLLALGLLATMVLATANSLVRAADQGEIDRAIERGVQALRSMKQANGTWQNTYIGATALAGLTLLECGAAKDDKDVLRAADAVRKASVDLTHTYSISLSIVFLDRLGDGDDKPLIEALMVRLLAGQDPTSGGWSYNCPAPTEAEARSLREKIKESKGEASGPEPASPDRKRKAPELSPETRGKLQMIERAQAAQEQGLGFPQAGLGSPIVMGGWGGLGDNSNTQFATLALWVGQRHGLPIERALTRLDRRFRGTQMEDGGWTYVPFTRPPGMAANAQLPPGMTSTAAMTCAGLLGLAIADGYTLKLIRDRKADAKVPNIDDDKHLSKGLETLGAVIDNPKNLKAERGFNPAAPGQADRVGGRTYYFLWSLERVAVALDLKTIGKKDWYGWGAEILVENQRPDGSWVGDYGTGCVDICFALLFLKRANLLQDLTAQLKGRVKDPGERTLRGGIGLSGLSKRKMQSGIETLEAKPFEKPVPKAADSEGGKLAESVLTASGSKQFDLLGEMESGKGAKYTEALAAAIPKLEGDALRKAREALANRLTRMKDDTLIEYLQDEDAEIRRAAALAIGTKESKDLVPNLIAALRDPEINVVRAAHASLKALTTRDFGPAAKATREERDQAVLKWIEWWSKQRKKSAKE